MIKITIAVLALLGFASAGYINNAGIKYNSQLDCTSCIRGGYNFCYGIGPGLNNNGTAVSWTCDEKDRTPNMNISKDGGVAGGYVCSRGMADEMNAIINGCRPYMHQNLGDYCGPYIIDLSENNNFAESRNIKSLPVNSSCTYRAFSTCGFPEMKFRINNDAI